MKLADMVVDCCQAEENAPEGLYDDYELEFLDDIQIRIEMCKDLTDKQETFLQELYNKACKSNY